MKRFEALDHTGDIGILVYGGDLQSVFENAGGAFFHQITGLKKDKNSGLKEIGIRGERLECLLVSWLHDQISYHSSRVLISRCFFSSKIRDVKIQILNVWINFFSASSLIDAVPSTYASKPEPSSLFLSNSSNWKIPAELLIITTAIRTGFIR
jgi:SHS2 domain-containing protein